MYPYNPFSWHDQIGAAGPASRHAVVKPNTTTLAIYTGGQREVPGAQVLPPYFIDNPGRATAAQLETGSQVIPPHGRVTIIGDPVSPRVHWSGGTNVLDLGKLVGTEYVPLRPGFYQGPFYRISYVGQTTDIHGSPLGVQHVNGWINVHDVNVVVYKTLRRSR